MGDVRRAGWIGHIRFTHVEANTTGTAIGDPIEARVGAG